MGVVVVDPVVDRTEETRSARCSSLLRLHPIHPFDGWHGAAWDIYTWHPKMGFYADAGLDYSGIRVAHMQVCRGWQVGRRRG